jgi:hypothetical protein
LTVNQKASTFKPEKFEDHYEEALTELINAKRNGKTVSAKPRPRGDNVVDLMDALKKSIAGETSTKGKKPRKASAGQKEMLLPIEGKKPAAKKAAKGWRERHDACSAPRYTASYTGLIANASDIERNARRGEKVLKDHRLYQQTASYGCKRLFTQPCCFERASPLTVFGPMLIGPAYICWTFLCWNRQVI